MGSPLRCESSPGFYPFFSVFLYLYSTLDKLAQSHDFKYFLYANNSQVCFSSSDLSLKLLWDTAIWFSHITTYICRQQEIRKSVSVSPLSSTSHDLLIWDPCRSMINMIPPVLSSVYSLLTLLIFFLTILMT